MEFRPKPPSQRPGRVAPPATFPANFYFVIHFSQRKMDFPATFLDFLSQ